MHRSHIVLPLAMVALIASGPSCAPASSAPHGVIAGLLPAQNVGLEHAGRLTDGQVPPDGSPWNGDLTATGQGTVYADYDLGEPTPIRAAWLQADNNDVYAIGVSDDGKEFRTAWVAPPVPAQGMQVRHTRDLDVVARHVRVVGMGGDGVYSLAELTLYREVPEVWPPRRPRTAEPLPLEGLRALILGLPLLVAAALGTTFRSVPRWAKVLALATGVVAAGLVSWKCAEAWPVPPIVVSTLRAAAALTAVAALVRLAFERRFPGSGRAPLAVLAAAAALAAACFLNLGHGQFVHDAEQRFTHVHPYDMRVYYPVAKYFPELRFDGVYEGSVAALLASHPEIGIERFADVPLRDLRTHDVVRVRDVADRIQSFRGRFTAGRWREFVRDMSYFERSMGVGGYLGSMLDHGGNATPTWLAFAHVLFRFTHASEGTLLAFALIDPLLLAGMFYALYRVFGAVTALSCLVVFGANDFYMGGGTSWLGATLRHDWLAALGFAAAAFGSRRHASGGALLALSAALRAFPALSLVGVVAVGTGSAVDAWRSGQRPSARELLGARPPVVRALLGAAAGGAALLVLSAAVLGASAWTDWLHKVSLLSRDPHPNHVGLRALLSFSAAGSDRAAAEASTPMNWQGIQLATFASRATIHHALWLAYTGLLLVACRKQPLERAAVLGLMLVAIWLYPANYYLHAVCFLPLLAGHRQGTPDARATTVLVTAVGSCALHLGAYGTPYVDEHYLWLTATLLATLPVVAVASMRRAPEAV